ncbi:hypothetical protein F4779DRAFT_612402, partial [Xylariaceae sp. FL0662B]
NRRRPVPPKLSDRHKADLVNLKRRWITFAAKMGHRDWKCLIKTLSYENKGLGESFMRYLMRQAEMQGKPIRSENAIRVHTRKLGGLYRKYNGHPPKRLLMDHLRNVIRSEITPKFALRREPKIKPIMGPDLKRSTGSRNCPLSHPTRPPYSSRTHTRQEAQTLAPASRRRSQHRRAREALRDFKV